jgi:hypothetical protein
MSYLFANQKLWARLELRHCGGAVGVQFLVGLSNALDITGRLMHCTKAWSMIVK